MKSLFASSLLVLTGTVGLGAEFQNLGFEEASTNNLTVVYPGNPIVGYGPAAEFLPGWTLEPALHRGGSLEPILWLDVVPVGGGFASIYDHNVPYGYAGMIDGNYELAFWPRFDPQLVPFTISQAGTIASDAVKLTYWSVGSFDVRINGQLIVGGDVSAYAGREVTLSFTTVPPGAFPPYWLLDNIRFVMIPEPSSAVLLGLGGLVFWLTRGRLVAPAP